ncbi:MAG: ABC transporter permease [Candidatus Dormiibacterota bacterium]
MLQHAIRRVLLVIPTLFGMSVLIFGMVRLLPGDVVTALLSGDVGVTKAKQAALRRSLGLSDPIPVQYWNFVKGLVTGHLGNSLVSGRPVSSILLGALPITFELALLAGLLAIAVGVPLGVVSAVRPNGLIDLAARVSGLAGVAVPNFWLATLILLGTSLLFHWIPPVVWVSFFEAPAGNLEEVFIPVIAISLYPMAIVMRMARASMLEVLNEDFVRTARAKGAGPLRVVFRHALRNAVIPVITVIGFEVGSLLSGATVIEVMFGLPGIGYTMLQAVYTRDYPVVEVTAIVLAFTFVLVNTFVDLLYGVVDPRIEQR